MRLSSGERFSPLEQVSTGCFTRVGLLKKLMPLGKPEDMLT